MAVVPKENKPVPATKVGPALLATVLVPKLPKPLAEVVLATEVGPKLNGFTAAVEVLFATEPKAGGGAEVAGNDPNVIGAAGAVVEVVAGGE